MPFEDKRSELNCVIAQKGWGRGVRDRSLREASELRSNFDLTLFHPITRYRYESYDGYSFRTYDI